MVACALVACSLLLAEFVALALLWALGRPYDPGRARERLGSGFDTVNGRIPLPGKEDEGSALGPRKLGDLILQPYLGWEHLGTDQILDGEAAYFRSRESAANYDVFLFGGSVAMGFGQDASLRLIERLGADPRLAGRTIQVHNYARGAYKQPQQVMFLSYLLNLGLKPDAVIEIDGFNEVALGWDNAVGHVHPLYPALGQWTALAHDQRVSWPLVALLHEVKTRQDETSRFGGWALESGIWRSCVLGELAIFRLDALRGDTLEAHQRLFDHLQQGGANPVISGPAYPQEQLSAFGLIVRAWEESSHILYGICRQRSIDYLHVLQPTLFDEGSKPLTAAEIASSGTPELWIAGARTGYPLLRLAGGRLREAGVPFLDASLLFADVREDLYYDGCHFGTRGNEILADAIAEAFRAALDTRH